MNQINRVLCLLLLVCTGCGTGLDPKTAALNKYMKDVHKMNLSPSCKAIIVVSPNGCRPCIQKWVNMVLEKRQDDDLLFLVTTDETTPTIDVNRFAPDSVKHVLVDGQDLFYDVGLLRTPGAILLENSHIDTIVDVSGYNLDNKLAFIKSKL